MKLVKEHIGFKRGVEPKDAMNISPKKDFNSVEDMVDWVIENIHFVLPVSKMPRDIIHDETYWIKEKYMKDFRKFLDRSTIKNTEVSSRQYRLFNEYFHSKLKGMGYKSYKDPSDPNPNMSS